MPFYSHHVHSTTRTAADLARKGVGDRGIDRAIRLLADLERSIDRRIAVPIRHPNVRAALDLQATGAVDVDIDRKPGSRAAVIISLAKSEGVGR